ncbi:MAG: UTP--glucose-1-phosphate uridylyltransferase [Oscillospiraceae bacterium]|nr:UTP--glucose-1-phosphate uridylyltransferase [Oscillospiraceae bacterium]
MKVTKAVITAAGLGTRVLPISKSMPKEMLPIVDKPAIQYIVDEVIRSGIKDILIITSRGKTTIEDHFDRSPDLEVNLLQSGNKEKYESIVKVASMANIHYLRQKEMLGLGHAVLQAKTFAAGQPIAVLYGDDVVVGDNPATGQLCAAYEKYGKGIAGIKPVPTEMLTKVSSVKVEPIAASHYSVTDMIEKPAAGQEFSNYSILGRCVLPPSIFEILEKTPKGAGGEIQLTDAMRILATTEGMVGVEYEGVRYDMGNKLGYMKANVEMALQHPEIGVEFKKYIENLMGSL